MKNNRIWLGVFLFIAFLFLGVSPVLAYTSKELEAKVTIHVTGDVPTSAENFIVVLKGEAGAPMPAGSNDQKKEALCAGAGQTSFGNITYNTPGVYTYTVTQKNGSATGYTYDTASYKMQVLVKNGAGDDQLEIQTIIFNIETGEKTTKVDFWNEYASPVVNGKGDLVIQKQVTGNPPAAEQFTFQIFLYGTEATNEYPCMNMAGSVIKTIKSGDSITLSGGEYVTLADLPAGVSYKIVEASIAHYTPTPITGIIEGSIVEGKNEAVYTNHYNPNTSAPVTVEPPVEKQIKGNPSKDEVFAFILQADNANAPMPPNGQNGRIEKQITGAGSVEFGYMTFTSPGRYEYKIQEKKGSLSDWIYDETIYTMLVTVTDKDGRLSANVQYMKNEKKEQTETCTFVNQYGKGTSGNIFTQIGKAVKTGDKSPVLLLLLLLLAAVALIVVFLFKKKGKK